MMVAVMMSAAHRRERLRLIRRCELRIERRQIPCIGGGLKPRGQIVQKRRRIRIGLLRGRGFQLRRAVGQYLLEFSWIGALQLLELIEQARDLRKIDAVARVVAGCRAGRGGASRR